MIGIHFHWLLIHVYLDNRNYLKNLKNIVMNNELGKIVFNHEKQKLNIRLILVKNLRVIMIIEKVRKSTLTKFQGISINSIQWFRLTILSVIRMTSINPIYIKQQLSTMHQETRVILIHTTSYVWLEVFFSQIVFWWLFNKNIGIDHC